jgi:hypothetical protein
VLRALSRRDGSRVTTETTEAIRVLSCQNRLEKTKVGFTEADKAWVYRVSAGTSGGGKENA